MSEINAGDVFGQWTVLREDNDKSQYKSKGKRYICRCTCGTERSVKKSSLISGVSKSCGCSYNPPKNLDGKRFGKLTVIESIQNYEGSGRSAYRCLCDCGNEIIVKGSSIHKTNSCGCYRIDKTLNNIGKRFGSLTIENVYYSDELTYADCICDCGKRVTVRLDQLKSGNTKSCGCAKSPDLTDKQFGRLTVIKEVSSDTKQRKWLCKCDCGCETILTSNILTSGHTKSCGCLRSEKVSAGETFIAELLSSLRIKYKKEKTFNNCKNKKLLRYDFYLPEYNLCIEYDGEQHYKPIKYFGGDKAYQERIKNDSIKTEYCRNNNINLLRISSKSQDEIKLIILNVIQNPVTTTVV